MNSVNINEVSLAKAVNLYEQGNYDEAQTFFLSVLETDPKNPDALYFMGILDHQAGRSEVAEHRARDLLKVKPRDGKALNLLGTIVMSQGRLAEAADLFEQGMANNKSDSILHVNAAICNIGLGNPDKSIECCKIAISIDDKYANAYNIMGTAYLGKSEFYMAAGSFEKALDLNPDFHDARFNLGKAHLELGDLEKAGNCFNSVLEHTPHNANTLTGMGDISSLRKKYTEAAEYYEQAIRHNASFSPAYTGLGKVFFLLNDFEEAISYLKRAIELNPNNIEALFLTGNSFRMLKNPDAAAAAFNDLLEIDPENSEAKFLLAAVLDDTPPAKPDHNYVRQLFDEFSDTFDVDLGKVGYSAPEQLAELATQFVNDSDHGSLDIIDLGCGTGLCGIQFKGLAGNLKGIDISPRMIEAAKKRNIYSELETNDLLTALVRHQNDTDLVISADVFPYIGDLESIFLAVHSALRDNGLFLFTVESHAGDEDYRLSSTARYSHSRNYLLDLAKRRDMQVLSCESSAYRTEEGEPINGLMLAMRKN